MGAKRGWRSNGLQERIIHQRYSRLVTSRASVFKREKTALGNIRGTFVSKRDDRSLTGYDPGGFKQGKRC